MKIVNTDLAKEVWFVNDQDKDVQVLMRRFPVSMSIFAPNDQDGIVKLAWQRFNYCLVDWKGFIDENDKVLECVEENKRMVFDYDTDSLLWITSLISSFDKSITKKKS